MKKGFVVLLLLTVLFVAGCSNVPGGASPRDTAALNRAVQTGTQGIEFELLRDLPPHTIYDDNEIVSIVEVKNRGNFDIQTQDCFMQITGFDPNIIRGSFGTPRPCNEGIDELEGKSIYNTEGGFNQLEFTSSTVQLPDGVYEYEPLLNYLVCYNYETKASPLVCVDPLFYQVTAEQKTCRPHDVGVGGGQGGPVGVTHVGVNMVGKNKAVFDITIKNLGSGRVLSPRAGIQNCGQASLERQDLDKVNFEVSLAGNPSVDCKPRDRIVRLNNGVGKIVCTFNVPGTVAYETPLQVDLQYSYIDSQTRNVRIVKTPE